MTKKKKIFFLLSLVSNQWHLLLKKISLHFYQLSFIFLLKITFFWKKKHLALLKFTFKKEAATNKQCSKSNLNKAKDWGNTTSSKDLKACQLQIFCFEFSPYSKFKEIRVFFSFFFLIKFCVFFWRQKKYQRKKKRFCWVD